MQTSAIAYTSLKVTGGNPVTSNVISHLLQVDIHRRSVADRTTEEAVVRKATRRWGRLGDTHESCEGVSLDLQCLQSYIAGVSGQQLQTVI